MSWLRLFGRNISPETARHVIEILQETNPQLLRQCQRALAQGDVEACGTPAEQDQIWAIVDGFENLQQSGRR